METRAPNVVAVVVASDPDESFEETLRSLAAQDYAELSTLVMVARGGEEVAARVRQAHPAAFVAILETDRGFGAAINESMDKVEGASFLLLCHDDIRLEPDAVHVMVEEAFRSNAGIVTPKIVSMDDPKVLLHVGQGVDRFGTIIERVQPGELDQGQHDVVRDVFVAPGGATLIRDDLLRLLGGFDERFVAMGDDLELCWRARLAGARIVCAPGAVVAHAERLASGRRELFIPEGEDSAPSLSRLRRRNEVRTLVACWGLWERCWTILLLLAFNAGEVIVAVAGSDHDRAVDIRESWRVWWRERREDRRRRSEVAKIRTEKDRTIRSQQTRGATRARTFLTVLVHHGLDSARGAIPIVAEDEIGPEHVASFGGAFSEDEGFDELDDLGRRGGRHAGRRRLASARSLFFVVVVAMVIYMIGSRNLVGERLPLLGQLLPLRSLGATWHMALATWQPAGLGSTAPGSPGYLSLGLLGTLTLGQMGVAVRLLLLASVPIGAFGVARLLRDVASPRARVLSGLAFVGLALGVNAIAAGEVGAVVALGATPFVLRRMLRLLRVPPFDAPFEERTVVATKGWRRTRHGQVLSLGLLLALVGSLAPAVLVATGASLVGFLAVGLITNRHSGGGPSVLLSVGVAVILLAPLSIPAVLAGPSGLGVFGAASAPWSEPGLGGLLRFSIGPSGAGVLSWLLPAAALVPLLVARGPRLSLAGRLAGAAIASFALGLLVTRGGLGSFAPDLLVILAPAATAVAAMVGLGLAAFEVDLPGFRFGWRQIIALIGIAASVIGLVPEAMDSVGGRWKMPINGYADSLTFLGGNHAVGHRVLWIGDPRGIPGGSWTISPGLAWSTSTDGLPSNANLFIPPAPPAGGAVTDAVELALGGSTVRLGRLLAPTGISAIVVVTAAAPHLPGVQNPIALPPPPELIPALQRQDDLVQVPGSGGSTVFEVGHSMPIVGVRRAALPADALATATSSTAGWTNLGGPAEAGGVAPPGSRTSYLGIAPQGSFTLKSSAEGAWSSVFGWASTGPASPGPVSLRLTSLPLGGLINLITLGAWIVLGLLLLGRHRWLDWWWRPNRRRRAAMPALAEEASVESAPEVER